MTARRKKAAKKRRGMNTRDRRRAQAAAAMPDVKRIVKKHGRMAVANCLGKIKARDKQAERLAALKRDVAAMERSLR